jgi:hypothetical protein
MLTYYLQGRVSKSSPRLRGAVDHHDVLTALIPLIQACQFHSPQIPEKG